MRITRPGKKEKKQNKTKQKIKFKLRDLNPLYV